MSTKIEWTQETWNPIIGCNKISPGCDHCYAERMACRLAGNSKAPEEYKKVIKNGKWNDKTALVPSTLEKPFQWKKPRIIFVCSMGDIFHGSVNIEWIHKVMEIIQKCPQHTFLMLTKRPGNAYVFSDWFTKNIWIGVTAENQEQADKRIPALLRLPAAKRFVSIEPILGPVDLNHIDYDPPGMKSMAGPPVYHHIDALTGYHFTLDHKLKGAGTKQFNPLDWVILGGETGPAARPMNPDWVRSVLDQCQVENVPFFFKSWGEYIPSYDAGYMSDKHDQWKKTFGEAWVKRSYHFNDENVVVKVGRKQAGHLIDGKEWRQMP